MPISNLYHFRAKNRSKNVQPFQPPAHAGAGKRRPSSRLRQKSLVSAAIFETRVTRTISIFPGICHCANYARGSNPTLLGN